ncbi:MAG: addiction module antitoxin RelB [Bacteroidetes bacterium]|nr:MAG: addiction module antitoxin RelB [Bacteroidota bacterium]
MSKAEKELALRLLGLPVSSRAALAEKLISSLDETVDDEVEKLWIKEAERRYQEIMKKKVMTVPSEKVFKEAYSSII